MVYRAGLGSLEYLVLPSGLSQLLQHLGNPVLLRLVPHQANGRDETCRSTLLALIKMPVDRHARHSQVAQLGVAPPTR